MNVSIADCFAIAFTAGFLFGLVYEFLRIIRLIFQFKPAVFICDILFFVASAFAVIVISENLGNYVRIYTVLGFGAGVFAYIVTVGRILNIIENAMAEVWRKTLGRLFNKTRSILANFIGKIAHKAKAQFVKISEIARNNGKKLFNGLNLRRNIVYNNKGSENIGEGGNKNVIKAVVKRSP